VAPLRLCVAGGQTGRSYHFRRPCLAAPVRQAFLVHFLGEQKMNKEASWQKKGKINSVKLNYTPP